jgi:phosphoglycerol transferase MdoB-like AlkP superfamily enzyme
MFNRLPPLARFLLALTAINVALFAALRLLFWAVFHEATATAPWAEVLKALYLGFKFDLRLALLIGLPLALLGWIPPLDPARRRAARLAWLGYLGLAQCAALFLYFVDFGHYAYVRVRLNASLVDHLTPVGVAAQMVWETYPVLPGVLALAFLTAGYVWFVRRVAARSLAPAAAPLANWPRRAAVAALAVLYAFGMYGKWSRYPLRWSEAYFSPNQSVAALALNPVLYLSDSYGNPTRPYDLAKVREHYGFVSSLLGVQAPDPQKLEYARYVTPKNKPAAKYNLVVIHLESFAAFKAGVLGNRLNPTPYFDAIAKEGILFTNFFVPGVPTARSVFTMMTGVPDLSPNAAAASRNPLLVNQHTLVNALEGYAKYYFLGGSATWGNIRGLFTHNVPGLRVYEEGDYDAPPIDTWGVSDIVLFDKALEALAGEKEPFFAFIQTSGNHRPFTIPKDQRGFVGEQMDAAALKDNGFESVAAYNGMRFLDYSLGYWFERARKAPYFRNTVFIMYGDHGNPSTQQTPFQELYLTGFHVPAVIYAPGLIQGGRRIDTTASLTDALPTMLGILGVPYLNTGIGRDLLALGPKDLRFSLVGDNAVLDDEFYMRLDPEGPRLFRYRTPSGAEDVRDRHPEKVAELARLQEAILQTSRYMLYNNPARPHAPPGSAAGQAAKR